MPLHTSQLFASSFAVGTDWRDTARAVLEDLEKARTEGDGFNIGFIYMTDTLVEHAQSILGLFRTVTGVDHWIGAVGLGVCGTGVSCIDDPAISAMIGRFPQDSFAVFPAVDFSIDAARKILEGFSDDHEAATLIVHGDPISEMDPMSILSQLGQISEGFVVGGMSSSRSAHVHIADELMQGGISGLALSQDVPVATVVSQGCAPIGDTHIITKSEDNIIMELDDRPAFEVFADDLRAMATLKSGKDMSFESADIMLAENGELDAFQGEVHVAFPVSGADTKDYLVRNAIGIDPENGWIAVAQQVQNGERMMFVHRDDETVKADLSRALLDIRQRVIADQGKFAPRGAIYISCVARTMSDFGEETNGELGLVQEVIGDIPLVGFYANGEISNHRLYGYTGVLILFI